MNVPPSRRLHLFDLPSHTSSFVLVVVAAVPRESPFYRYSFRSLTTTVVYTLILVLSSIHSLAYRSTQNRLLHHQSLYPVCGFPPCLPDRTRISQPSSTSTSRSNSSLFARLTRCFSEPSPPSLSWLAPATLLPSPSLTSWSRPPLRVSASLAVLLPDTSLISQSVAAAATLALMLVVLVTSLALLKMNLPTVSTLLLSSLAALTALEVCTPRLVPSMSLFQRVN